MSKGNGTAKVEKEQTKSKKPVIITAVAIVLVALLTLSYFLIFRNMIQYNVAVKQIESGDFTRGYDNLKKVAGRKSEYKDTNELLYKHAIELIETGDIEHKKKAYDILMTISGYKDADSIVYYLWVEDVFDAKDENSYETADEFINMIPEDYDGPFAKEIAQYRKDVKAAVDDLNRRKAEAGMEEDDGFTDIEPSELAE